MPQHLPNPQPVRCHLLSGSHAFAFDAIHFDFAAVPNGGEGGRSSAGSKCAGSPATFIPVASGSHPGGGTIALTPDRAANFHSLSHEA